MGEVYRARDLKLKREVAFKILPEEFARDSDRLLRFQREAELLASLNHPNIAAIYDIGQDGSSRFIVLELVEGETLADRLERGPIPLDDANRNEDLRSAGGRAREGNRPPRPQAGECEINAGWTRKGPRLRPRENAGRRFRKFRSIQFAHSQDHGRDECRRHPRDRDVHVAGTVRGVFTRLTSGNANETAGAVSPDGALMNAGAGTIGDLYIVQPDNATPELLTTSGLLKHPNDVSPDGKYLIYDEHGRQAQDLLILLLNAGANANQFHFSRLPPMKRSASFRGMENGSRTCRWNWAVRKCMFAHSCRIKTPQPAAGSGVSTAGGDKLRWSRVVS
jgi:hypothetical protein